MLKFAFLGSEHKKITRSILGDRFDEELFDEIQKYIDGKGGFGHRGRHGHDKAAEDFIREKWGEPGVEIFRIHIVSDWVQDNLGDAVKSQLDRIDSGVIEMPYYTDCMPKCHQTKIAMSLIDTNPVGNGPKCQNCGDTETFEVSRWFRRTCMSCLEERGLEVCSNCFSYFAKSLRVNRDGEVNKFLCPICASNGTE